MGCAFLWTLWLNITFPFKREEENYIRNGSVRKLLRCDTSTLYSLLTLATLATGADRCWGNHRAVGALLEHLQVGSQHWLDFSCRCHMYSGNVRQGNSTREAAWRTQALPGTADLGAMERIFLGPYSSAVESVPHPTCTCSKTVHRKSNYFIQSKTASAGVSKAEVRTQFCQQMLFGSHSFWQIKDPIFSSCKWGWGSPLCCVVNFGLGTQSQEKSGT